MYAPYSTKNDAPRRGKITRKAITSPLPDYTPLSPHNTYSKFHTFRNSRSEEKKAEVVTAFWLKNQRSSKKAHNSIPP
jgi:hypothetical protein